MKNAHPNLESAARDEEVCREAEPSSCSSGSYRVSQSGTRPSLTLDEARAVIEELRAEDALRPDLQFAIGGR